MGNDRFADLKKVPKQPAARLLAVANAKLATPVKAPANAPVETVMAELAESAPNADALVDMIRLMSVALPARERVWWGCLAAREMIGPDPVKVPAPLDAAEKWVRKPGDETRNAARVAVEAADIDDDTVLCATSVLFFDDTLGPGDLAQYPGPPGASQAAAFGMICTAMGKIDGGFVIAANLLIDSALDIARGGNGAIKSSEPEKEPVS